VNLNPSPFSRPNARRTQQAGGSPLQQAHSNGQDPDTHLKDANSLVQDTDAPVQATTSLVPDRSAPRSVG
jgi:hypothetical protein